MEFLTYLVDFILHIDAHLFELVEQYGMWIYAILFIIVFCETGLVVTPFLPGDSLLFASGVVALWMSSFSPRMLMPNSGYLCAVCRSAWENS